MKINVGWVYGFLFGNQIVLWVYGLMIEDAKVIILIYISFLAIFVTMIYAEITKDLLVIKEKLGIEKE